MYLFLFYNLMKGGDVFMAKKGKPLFSEKVKDCFTPHVILHSAFGLGLGLMIPTFLPGMQGQTLFLIGVVFAVIGVFGDFFLKQ